MSVDFTEYAPCLKLENPEQLAILTASYQEACRLMSPRGVQNYLEGLRALCLLGRGHDLVLTYAQEIGGVVKEVGEDVIPDIVQAVMKLASHTSGTVLSLLLATLPMAAQRLGDADVLRGYLGLVHQLAGKVPRGLRPMLEHLDELLHKLTLGGLRRWALWGAQAHQRDLDGQMAYFGLKTESAKAVLQQERRGTLFVDNQRKLNFYLRALWGRSFFMRPTAGDYEDRQGLRPFIDEWQLFLPDAFDAVQGLDGVSVYRAAVTHCAAHIVYTRQPLNAEGLTPLQMQFVELFEDARIEYLACAEFPGLRKLWQPFFSLQSDSTDTDPVVSLLRQLAGALLKPDSGDAACIIDNTASAFRQQLATNPDDNQISWTAGVTLYNELDHKMSLPNVRILSTWQPSYRDDNRFMWAFDSADFLIRGGADYIPASQQQVRKNVSLMTFVNEIDVETAGDDAQEVWILNTELFPYEDEGISYNEMEGKPPVSEPFHYPEWDYQVQLHRPDWATVYERHQALADPAQMDDILVKYRPLATRIRHLIDALQPQGIVRRRGYEEGEEIDLNAAVRAMIDIRRGIMPDPRINIRITRHIRDLAVIILLDLSESTNERVHKEDHDSPTVLQLTREAAGLMAWAIDAIGDPFAIHGFASDSRHDVQYFRFKEFDQAYDDTPKARLAGMQGGLSTRMGAALRHAGWHLSQQTAQKRLILLITDGEPADIDERDPQYLRQDTKKAVEELTRQGVFTYCLTLDPLADQYVSRIFGANNYSVVDQVERLPERLPAVFAGLTG